MKSSASDRIGFLDGAALQIDDRVKRQRAGNASHRIDVDVADVRVALYELFDLRAVDLDGRVREGVRAAEEARTPLVIELDREILEAHGA
jgi:hypothetical protein